MPSHLLHDLALVVCPDFTLECFSPMCDAYSASTSLSLDNTITTLFYTWAKANKLQKMAWALQVDDDKRIRSDEEWIRDQEAAQMEEQVAAEPEAEELTIEKKKWKINDFDNNKLVGNMIIPTPSQYALNKHSSFNWIELWHCSPDTCCKATQQAIITTNDIYGLTKANNTLGLH